MSKPHRDWLFIATRKRGGQRSHGYAYGSSRHPIYTVWANMIQRCTNPKNHNWEDYGGRGITVCAEWRSPQVFVAWALANGWRPGVKLDREDNNGRYGPENCRFTSHQTNCRNRRPTIIVEIAGERMSLIEAAERHGVVRYETIRHRFRNAGWDLWDALTTPSRERKS